MRLPWSQQLSTIFLNWLCSQPSPRANDQASINCRSCGSWESNSDSPYSDISAPFFIRTWVPRLPNMVNYLFSMHLRSPMEIDCRNSKKQGTMSATFHSAAVITAYCVTLITAAYWKETLIRWRILCGLLLSRLINSFWQLTGFFHCFRNSTKNVKRKWILRMLRDITWKHKLLRQQLWDLVGMPYMSITRLTTCTKLRSMRGIIRSMTIIIIINFLGYHISLWTSW